MTVTTASMKTEAGLSQLNDLLSQRSYVGSETEPTSEDFKLCKSLSTVVDRKTYPHVYRWSRHLVWLQGAFPYRKWPEGTSVATVPAQKSEMKAKDLPRKEQDSAAPAPEKAEKKKEEKKVDKKSEGKKSEPKPEAGGDEDDAAAAQIQLIVGKVTKVWEHPDSEKLWCEEIDCGEAEVRQIGSGLRAFYKAEDFQDRMVLVVGNLKPKKLAGFPSNGMVLCASNAAHDDVKFVEVPAGAKVGDRVMFGDMPMAEPAAPGPCEKKKLFAKAQPHFVSKGGVAMYKDKPFTLTAGVCTAPVADGYSLS